MSSALNLRSGFSRIPSRSIPNSHLHGRIIRSGARNEIQGNAGALLKAAHGALATLDGWDHDRIEQCIRGVAETNEVKLGKLAQPLRAALTGRTTSPGIFDVLALLGRDESLARIADQMEPTE